MGPWGDGFTETGSLIDFTGFAGGFWDPKTMATISGPESTNRRKAAG